MIPERLAQRPRHGNLPIPYVTAIDERGVPDFRSHDPETRLRCASMALCQLCGQALPTEFVLIGFPIALERGRFGEPPACPECMEFAWSACPWLASSRRWEADWGDVATIVPRPAWEPSEMAWVVADSYEWVPDRTGFGLWVIEEPLSWELRTRGG